jgi:hypothetical protein
VARIYGEEPINPRIDGCRRHDPRFILGRIAL